MATFNRFRSKILVYLSMLLGGSTFVTLQSKEAKAEPPSSKMPLYDKADSRIHNTYRKPDSRLVHANQDSRLVHSNTKILPNMSTDEVVDVLIKQNSNLQIEMEVLKRDLLKLRQELDAIK